MTEHDARPEDDLWVWPQDDTGDQADWSDAAWDDAAWDDAAWDDAAWDDAAWDHYVSSRHHPRPLDQPRSPQRTSRLLLSLIVVAAAALVVAVAALVSGNFAGRIPTSPQLATPTSEPEPVIPSSSTIPGGTSPPHTSAEVPLPVRTTLLESAAETPRQVPSAPTPAAPEPAASEPAASQPAASVPTAEPSKRRPESGPRINVTRTPMSFTPGIRGN